MMPEHSVKDGIVTEVYDDLLVVSFEGAKCWRAREAPHDGYLILHSNKEGNVVAVEALCFNTLLPKTWPKHPDRESIPLPLRDVLDAVIQSLGSSE